MCRIYFAVVCVVTLASAGIAQEIKPASAVKFRNVRNLTLERDLPQDFAIPAGETWILKLGE